MTVEYGVQKDWSLTTSTLTRLGNSIGKIFAPTVGTTIGQNDFESIRPWSECILCNLADNGAVNAYFGEPGFKLDGTNGQVMLRMSCLNLP